MKYSYFKRFKFSNIFKNINFKRYNFSKINREINFKTYKFYRYTKNQAAKKYKSIIPYGICFLAIVALAYLYIPTFFKYSKSEISNAICKNINVECSIEDKIKYSFFPTPRLKIKKLIIKELSESKKTIMEIEDTVLKISIYNLFDKKKQDFTKLKLLKSKIYLNYEDIKNYKKLLNSKINLLPIDIQKSKINFSNENKEVFTINDLSLKFKSSESLNEINLEGELFGDQINIDIKKEKESETSETVIVLKLINTQIFTKFNLIELKENKEIIRGNVLFKKNKNRIRGVFEYDDNKIIFKQGDLRNDLMRGKFTGYINFLPYFDFDLNIDLKGLNVNKLTNLLFKVNKNKTFEINKKINGKLNLSSEKIYSKYNLFKSFESDIKLSNGSILVDRLIFNMGKLGATDITGMLTNDKKFSNFKFENNIFLDNEKRFFSKFGIYDRKDKSSNLYTSGVFDLKNLQIRFNEINGEEKFPDEDVDFIEKEFNNIMLLDGYTSFFDFLKLKEFVKTVTPELN